MTPLTEDSNRCGSTVHDRFLLVVVAAIAILAVSCVSEPEPAAEDSVPTDSVTAVDDGTGAAGGEPALDLPLFHLLPSAESRLSVDLPEPGLQEPDSLSLTPEETADGSSQSGADQPEPDQRLIGQADITVLSRLPEAAAIVVPMPDPVLPVLPDPLPPATVPAPKAPRTATVPVPPAAPKNVAAPETASSAKEVTGASGNMTEPEPLPAPVASPVPVLPIPPSSSARSVDATPIAIPETRVEVARGQRFELRLRVSGWTFLGDEDGKDGVRYETRRFEDNHAVFVMNPSRTGEYLLRFQRQDPLELRTEASLVRLLVNPAPTPGSQAAGPSALSSFVVASAGSPAPESAASLGAVSAPAFPTTETAALVGSALGGSSASGSLMPAGSATLPNALGAVSTPAATATPSAASTSPTVSPPSTQATTQAATASATQAAGLAGNQAADLAATQAAGLAASQAANQPGTQIASQASSLPAALTLTDPAALIKLARDELSAKRVSVALEALDRYKFLYPYVGDEVFYLYALAYEQDTPLRDIKKAYENYRRVRDEFPRSQFWRQSADKTVYLERHYPGLR